MSATTLDQPKISRRLAAKKHNHTQEESVLSPFRSWAELLEDDFTSLVTDPQWRKKFCLTLLKWADEDDSIELEQFYLKYRFYRRRVYEWRDTYPEIKEVFDEVRLFVGMRRRVGAVTRKYDKDAVAKDWHRYDPEYDEVNKYHMKLKAMQASITNQLDGKSADDRYIYIRDIPEEQITTENGND